MARSRSLTRTRRAQRPRWWTIAVLLLASITLITLSERGSLRGTIAAVKRLAHDGVSPVQRNVDSGLRPVGDAIAGIVHYGSLAHENAVLRHQLQQLQGQQLQKTSAQNALQQLQRLQQAAGLRSVAQIPRVVAEVTAVDSSNFADTVDLSKGTAAGVDVGMPVVTGTGLVGLVVNAWATGSTVRLITDTASSVSVGYGSGSSAGTAIVAGKGPRAALEVDLVAPGVHLRKGMVLTTSGLQHGRFPPGLPVATITSFSSSASSTQQNVTARPTAALGQLQYVDVLQWQAPPLPPGAS